MRRVVDVLSARDLRDEKLRESRKWVFPAPTAESHINADSVKKQHAKALKIVGERKAFKLGWMLVRLISRSCRTASGTPPQREWRRPD